MKALIFAAGLGTRLKPLTDTMPKALVPINGKPLLELVLQKLIASGFDEIIINVHHFADQIIDFVKQNNSFGVRIEISDERDALLETGGGIKKASWFFDDGEPFLVHNVDILSNIDLRKLYNYHLSHNGIATVVVSKRDTARYLLFDNTLRLNGWTNIKTGEVRSPFEMLDVASCQRLAFSGIHVISPKIFDLMSGWDGKFSVIDFYLKIAAKETIKGFVPENLKMIDVGKIDSLHDAELFLTNSL
ncbi:nucleotidyltransferase family protein [Paludibacter jiangxiensis]|uniref:Nucleotidyl transferase n=1 Tax=Paludibacter jiangxiensis TaxID=681398 RepID=A0A161LHN8_9BACT|nr:nucleotidyltransferase family protein [Paludibacter jiangxiensis]GAT61706.1 nucleotidyl transferase [Paludibacter jiangxiensis]